jgi:2'-5' RNA ligase
VRLFVALDPPEEVRAHLATALRDRAPDLFRGAKPARPEQWHLTLAFLGEVPGVQVSAVWSAVARAAGTTGPLRLRLAGAGAFGQDRAVVWVGLTGDTEELQRLAGVLRDRLRVVRVPLDTRPFRPHLTVARGVDLRRAAAAAALAALTSYEGPWWTAQELTLLHSRLGAGVGGSPRYDPVGAFPLGGPRPVAPPA